MSGREFDNEKNGQYSDAPFTDRPGRKWLWSSEDSARKWQDYLESHDEHGLITTKIPVAPPLDGYETHSLADKGIGTSHAVPIIDLGPAQPVINPPNVSGR
jgi:hypothetical protein